MSTETEELVRICEALPQNKRAEVTDFAKFLLDQQADAAWEQTINNPRALPKLEEFVRLALEEGSEPLDENRL
jgi:hypothetical protein